MVGPRTLLDISEKFSRQKFSNTYFPVVVSPHGARTW